MNVLMDIKNHEELLVNAKKPVPGSCTSPPQTLVVPFRPVQHLPAQRCAARVKTSSADVTPFWGTTRKEADAQPQCGALSLVKQNINNMCRASTELQQENVKMSNAFSSQ